MIIDAVQLILSAFSPLFIGAKVETTTGYERLLPRRHPFSPLFIGAKVETA